MNRLTSSTFQPVEDWLRNLGLLHYAQSFYDNGYEDIETVKLIGVNDLNAIGITSETDRSDILSAVSRLKSNVYFELEVEPPKKETERCKYDTIQLKSKLKELLVNHNLQLIEPPYYNPDGSLGELYSLAIRFAEELNTDGIDDVLEALEQLRKRQLPPSSYDLINDMAVSIGIMEKRRSMSSTSLDPVEYLDCKSSRPAQRSLSLSKHDTRVTKSTTDLSHEFSLANSPADGSKSGKKIERNKSLFGNVFRKKEIKLNKEKEKSCDFVATDVTLSQNEIKSLFEKLKAKEISEADVLAVIKKGSLKSVEGFTPEETGKVSRHSVQRKDRLSKSMIKRPSVATAQAQDNSDGVSLTGASSSISSTSSRNSNDSISLQDFGSITNSNASSPEMEKSGIFATIRNSIRKKKSNDSIQEISFTSYLPEYTVSREHESEEQSVVSENLSSDSPAVTLTEEFDLNSGERVLKKTVATNGEAKLSALPSYSIHRDKQSGIVDDISSNAGKPQDDSVKPKPLPPPRLTRSSVKPQIPTPLQRSVKHDSFQRSISLESPSTPSSIDKIGFEMSKLIEDLDVDLENINNKKCDNEENVIVAKKPMIPPRSLKRDSQKKISVIKPTKALFDHNKFKLELEDSLKVIELTSSSLDSPPINEQELKDKIQLKLESECVKLGEEPYTSPAGEWNVPLALVERYAKELILPVEKVARLFEAVRVEERKRLNLSFISMNIKKFSEAKDVSVDKWLIDVGLPMFVKPLKDYNIKTLRELSQLFPDQLQKMGRFQPEHVKDVLEKAKRFNDHFCQHVN